ncbi:MAG: hypothetical protein ICV62_06650 [Cyanobacteria bacterium Co-bin13]|nr:hypothetical protein [Cyanobacteria bacterium Co-bin13]
MGLKRVVGQVLTLNPDYAETANQLEQPRRQAQGVVVLAAVSHALGSTVILLIYRASLPLLLLGLGVNSVALWAGYLIWSFAIAKLGQGLKIRQLHYRQILPLVGFAHIPQVFNFLTVVPLLGRPIEITLATWSLLAVIVAVQQRFDIRYQRAIALASPGWLLVQVATGTVQVLVQQVASP